MGMEVARILKEAVFIQGLGNLPNLALKQFIAVGVLHVGT